MQYWVSNVAIRQAQELGLVQSSVGDDRGPTIKKLAEMAKLSAIVTHPMGNRRFGDWVLQLNENKLESLARYEFTTQTDPNCPDCRGRGTVNVSEECSLCDGSGCQACNGMGFATRAIPCQGPRCVARR